MDGGDDGDEDDDSLEQLEEEEQKMVIWERERMKRRSVSWFGLVLWGWGLILFYLIFIF